MSSLFWDFLHRRVKGDEKGVPWFVNDKLKANEFFSENGFPAPKLLHVFESVDEVDLDVLPDSFCIKPTVMHSASGVLPLVKVAAGKYFDMLRRRIVSGEAVKYELGLSYEKCSFKGSFRVLVEEALEHPVSKFLIPCDYKFYTFKNKVAFIEQIDRNSGSTYIGFFDGDFSPMPYSAMVKPGVNVPYTFCTPRVPKFSKDMLECAKRVVDVLDSPFLRVDMYAMKDRYVLGEITPAPGLPYYKKVYEMLPEWDEKLGRLWADGISEVS